MHTAWIVFLFLFCVFSGPLVNANEVEHTLTWIPALSTGYSLDVTHTLCPATTGVTTLTGIVHDSFGNVVSDANVFATIRKPDNTTTDSNFVNDLSGVYTLAYNFNLAGTYFIQAHAYQPGKTQGDWNGYIYVGNLSWTTAFLNNGFTADSGELSEIRNTVTNNDGNLVYDINVNTTIYYPDDTVADANKTMTQISNGEFVYSFFAPSTPGAYSVATLFSCDGQQKWDDSGTFSVNAPAPGGNGGSSGGGGSGGSGGGGFGGSGGGGLKKAKIISIVFDPSLSKNAPSSMNVTVKNQTSDIMDYVLHYTITSPSNVVTSGSKNILAVGPLNTTTIVANNSYTPLETGAYTVELMLTNLTGLAVYDKLTQSVSVSGQHAITLDVQPSSDKTALGLTFPFTINVLNNGDFTEEGIDIEWMIAGPDGVEYIHSNIPTSLTKGESKSFTYAPFVPLTAGLGLHELTVLIHAYGVTQEKKVMFTVSSPTDYYAELIADLELRIDQLDDKIDSLGDRGFDVKEESLMLLDIQTKLSMAKALLLSGKLDGLNTKLIEISSLVTKLAAMVDALEQQAPLLSREGLNLLLYVGIGLLFGLFIWFMYWFLANEKKRAKPAAVPLAGPQPVSWLSRLLRVEKTYYSLPEREKRKQKPLISRILGLEEE